LQRIPGIGDEMRGRFRNKNSSGAAAESGKVRDVWKVETQKCIDIPLDERISDSLMN